VALRSVNPGFDARHVLTMRLSLTGSQFQKSSAVAEVVRDSLERIRAMPGVLGAASSCCLPMGDNLVGEFDIVGRQPNGRSHGTVDVTTISPAISMFFASRSGAAELFPIGMLTQQPRGDYQRNVGP